MLLMFYKILNGDALTNLLNILEELVYQNVGAGYYNLRNVQLRTPLCRTKQYQNSFFPLAIQFWNLLPREAKIKPTLTCFKYYLKKKTNQKSYIIWETENYLLPLLV